MCRFFGFKYDGSDGIGASAPFGTLDTSNFYDLVHPCIDLAIDIEEITQFENILFAGTSRTRTEFYDGLHLLNRFKNSHLKIGIQLRNPIKIYKS
jgi:hypothetical protein